jgi:hypothetical protein
LENRRVGKWLKLILGLKDEEERAAWKKDVRFSSFENLSGVLM